MMRLVPERLLRLSIRTKLFITFLALVTVPILMLLAANLYFTSKSSEQQARYTMGQVLSQTQSNLEFKTEAINNLLNILALNATLQEMSLKDSRYYENNIGAWMVDNQNLTSALYFTFENPNISSLHFYMKEGLASAVTTEEYLKLSDAQSALWYTRLQQKGYDTCWFAATDLSPDGGDFLSAVRGMPGSLSINDIIGIVRIDLDTEILRKTLEQSLFTQNAAALLVNADGQLLCSTGNLSGAELTELCANLPAVGTADGQDIHISGSAYLSQARHIAFTDWTLLIVVPYRDIQAYNITFRNQILLIYLIIAPLTLPLSLLVSNSATKRIRRLIQQMKKVEQGSFAVSLPAANHDEIGQMTQSFQFMLQRIEGLMNERIQTNREMKNLEIKALQAQINPHFLYNTLDLINWMALRSGAPGIGQLVAALGKFYKLSLSHGEDIVTLRNEMEHVKSYVQIQNMRFNDNITLEVDVPDELMDCRIVKLVLQPIVENAILHGILEKEDERGVIRITANRQGDALCLQVYDDGVGIPPERIQEILSGESTRESHGYGVHNINERLKLNYGSEFGLRYRSKVGEYTIVTVLIPATLPASA